MKRLIVNADDFGFTRGVNAGIIRAFKAGIVTSTTIMANGEAFEDAAALARSNPGLGVGCHLAIVGGRPVAPAAQVPTLVDRNGALAPTLAQLTIKLARGLISSEDIAREFRAQLERVTSAGITLTHLDSHKHSHTLPQVMEVLARVAAEFGIKRVRNPFEKVFGSSWRNSNLKWPYLKQAALAVAIAPAGIRFKLLAREHGLRTPDRFFGVRLTGMLDTATIQSIIKSLGAGTAELMCHPGVYDDDLAASHTRLKRERERELEALTDKSVRGLIEEKGIELITYREL